MKEITPYSRLERGKYFLNYYTLQSGKTVYIIHTFLEDKDTIVGTLTLDTKSHKLEVDMEVDTMYNVCGFGEDFASDLFFELDESEYNLIVLSESI